MMNYNNFKTDTNGNVAIMFAVSAVMLLTGIGAAVDYTNLSRTRSALQAQVDAAVLAAATVEIDKKASGYLTNGKGEQLRTDAAKKVISANGFDLNGIDPVITINKTSVEVRAEVDYRPFFGGFLGVDSVRLAAEAESGLPGSNRVDIALVLDSTHSMSVDGKMDALKDGAVSLVDAVEESGSESRISIVPFARYVRLNDSVRNESWFQLPNEYDTTRTYQKSNKTGGTCVEETRTRTRDGVVEEYQANNCTGQTVTYEEVTTDIESRWEGCAGTRMPPFSERDDAYSHKIPGLVNRAAYEKTGLSYDVWATCPAEIVPVTNDYDKLKNAIKGMWSTDNTYLPMGLMWGQRVLSPGVPFDNSSSDDEAGGRKVMILMTDGENTTQIKQDATSVANWSAPPYISSVADDKIATDANAATARLCESAKDNNIEIYTIAFQVSDASTSTLLKNCATDPGKALTADSNAALVAEFERIATEINADIRLIR